MSYLRKLWHGGDFRLAEGYTHIAAKRSSWEDTLPLCLLHCYRKWHLTISTIFQELMGPASAIVKRCTCLHAAPFGQCLRSTVHTRLHGIGQKGAKFSPESIWTAQVEEGTRRLASGRKMAE